MSLFICRWQKGDFSAVSAESREEAITLLDEVGNAELGELFTISGFMVHFRLRDSVKSADDMTPIELREFGEQTHDMLYERLYPEFAKTASAPEGTNPTFFSSSATGASSRVPLLLVDRRRVQRNRRASGQP